MNNSSNLKLADLIKFESDDIKTLPIQTEDKMYELELKHKVFDELINMQMENDEYATNKFSYLKNKNNLMNPYDLDIYLHQNTSIINNSLSDEIIYKNDSSLPQIKIDTSDFLFNEENSMKINLNNFSVNDDTKSNLENIIIPNNKNSLYDNTKNHKVLFQNKLKEMKNQTENYLDSIKINFINYIENQKKHFRNSLTTLEDILEMESKNKQAEESKIKTIDKKLKDFSTEFNNLIKEINKIKN